MSELSRNDAFSAVQRLRALATLVLIYVGLVAGLVWIVKSPVSPLGANPERTLLLLLGAASIFVLGPGAIQESFGQRAKPVWLVVAPILALLVVAVSIVWVRHWFGPGSKEGTAALRSAPSLFIILASTLLVAYSEELVFRGVLWAALVRRSMGALRPIIQTAVLFALAHLISGGQFGELPHRFFAGVLLATLRWKSESIWPCIHVHWMTNLVIALAVA